MDSEVCLREECWRIERVIHLFWECAFAKKVWRRLEKTVKGLTGVDRMKYELYFVVCVI